MFENILIIVTNVILDDNTGGETKKNEIYDNSG
jgi:hypothetical protein